MSLHVTSAVVWLVASAADFLSEQGGFRGEEWKVPVAYLRTSAALFASAFPFSFLQPTVNDKGA